MKFQIKVDDMPIQWINNFCMSNDLELDVETMTIQLSEIYFDGR